MKKEEEAQQNREGSVKRDVPAFLRSPVVPKIEPQIIQSSKKASI